MACNPAEPLSPGGLFRCIECDGFCTYSPEELARFPESVIGRLPFIRCPVCSRRLMTRVIGGDGPIPAAASSSAKSRREHREAFVRRRMVGSAELAIWQERRDLYSITSPWIAQHARNALNVDPVASLF